MLTDAEKVILEAHTQTIAHLHKQLQVAENAHQEFVGEVLTRTLLAGMWTVSDGHGDAALCPADERTERALNRTITAAFGLGYHSSAQLKLGDLDFYVTVDDGEVQLRLGGADPEKFREAGVTIDEDSLRRRLLAVYERAQRKARSELQRAQVKLDAVSRKMEILSGQGKLA